MSFFGSFCFLFQLLKLNYRCLLIARAVEIENHQLSCIKHLFVLLMIQK